MDNIKLRYHFETPKKEDPDSLNLTVHAYKDLTRVASMECSLYNMEGEDVCRQFANTPDCVRNLLMKHYTRDVDLDEYWVCHLEYIRVIKTARGQGIGSHMVKDLINFLQDNEWASYILLQPYPLDLDEKAKLTALERKFMYSNKLASFYRRFKFCRMNEASVMQIKLKRPK
jgi:GNAT superfamily N-acetyltransferase